MKHPWPRVLSEEETLRLVLEGWSLARYGDGEFKLCLGGPAKAQQADPQLQKRLRHILKHDTPGCLVGIPNLHRPTKDFWQGYRRKQITDLFDMSRHYGSAFVSRPDSAPWIHTAEYWRQVESLWKGRAVTLVRGSGKSLTKELLSSASSVTEIICARQNAWSNYADLLEAIGRPSRALLCCGPMATVLAFDLCVRGVHAVDLGHIGMWFKRQTLTVEAALSEGRAE